VFEVSTISPAEIGKLLDNHELTSKSIAEVDKKMRTAIAKLQPDAYESQFSWYAHGETVRT
jgi:hypothetical protein